MRKLKFKESVHVQGASLGFEVGSVWLWKPHFPSVLDSPTATSSATCPWPRSHWVGIFQAFAEKRLGPTQLPGSVCSHPRWSFPGFSVHSRFGRTGRKSEVLCPKCLQKWDLKPRLSCQLLVATSVYLRESHSYPWAMGALFRVGKGVEARGPPSFLFSEWQN